MRKCGLKLSGNTSAHSPPEVTSLAEVWIEIRFIARIATMKKVTSLAEVWIEIFYKAYTGRGTYVTSLAEVWIEIPDMADQIRDVLSHFPCGSVD